MKLINFVIFISALCILLSSCNKNEESEITRVLQKKHDCVFVQNDANLDGLIDDDERKIMNDCMANMLSSVEVIKNNLIGEWELVGHGEGWIPTKSQPCGYIIFDENELQFEFDNGYLDTVVVFTWDVEKIQGSGGSYIKLNTSPTNYLFLNQFCSEYMYSDRTPFDGDMYLYHKVK